MFICLYNVHVWYCIPGSPNAYYNYVTCVRFEVVKSPKVTLCGCQGYKPSINKSIVLSIGDVLQVCRASKQFLKLMMKKAVLNVQDINPMLFSYVEQLNDIKVLLALS